MDPKTVRRVPVWIRRRLAKGCVNWQGSVGAYGYRRLGILLAREGMTMNVKKLYRLYRE